jgi:hypothetical protein
MTRKTQLMRDVEAHRAAVLEAAQVGDLLLDLEDLEAEAHAAALRRPSTWERRLARLGRWLAAFGPIR